MFRFAKVLVIVLVIFAVLNALSGFYVNWLWFKDLGYLQLFCLLYFERNLAHSVRGGLDLPKYRKIDDLLY